MHYQDAKVKSVAKAFRLLDELAEARRPLSLQELAQRTTWPKSSIHATLATLVFCGAVEQDYGDGKYMLGMRLFELGSVVSSTWDILSAARPHMQSIMFQTGESVSLAASDKGEALLIDCVDSGSPLRVVAQRGARLPLHATALGKAMLANWEEGPLKGLLTAGPLLAYTPHTMTTAPLLDQELTRIRLTGYAVENGEMRVGMRGVAAPIFDVTGAPRYAIGVTSMFRRITDETFLLAQQLVIDAAGRISHEMGFRPS